MRRMDEVRGETLIEILVAIVLLGLIVSAFFATILTGTRGSIAHRDFVTADSMLRDYAEAIKAQVRDSATGCGVATPSTFSVATPAPRSGITMSATPTVSPGTCPPATQVMPERLVATFPNGKQETLDIELRTP